MSFILYEFQVQTRCLVKFNIAIFIVSFYTADGLGSRWYRKWASKTSLIPHHVLNIMIMCINFNNGPYNELTLTMPGTSRPPLRVVTVTTLNFSNFHKLCKGHSNKPYFLLTFCSLHLPTSLRLYFVHIGLHQLHIEIAIPTIRLYHMKIGLY